MIFLAVGVLIVLYSALGALLAGPVLQRALTPSGSVAPGLWNGAYVSGVLALTAWALVTWTVMFFVPLFDPYWALLLESVAESALPWGFLDRPAALLGGTLTVAVLQLPGMLAGSRLVGWHIGSRVEGTVTMGRVPGATAAAVVATWPIVAIGAWIMALVSR